MPIQFNFKFTDAFVVESLARYRRQCRSRLLRITVKILALGLLLPIACWIFTKGFRVTGACLILGGVVMVFAHHLDNWILQRAFRKSPFHNEDVTVLLREDGLQMTTRKSDSNLSWSVFAKAVLFQDGLLLFQAPRSMTWLPFSALEDGSAVEPLGKLLAVKVNDFRTCGVELRPKPSAARSTTF